jgi:hypothetical protein
MALITLHPEVPTSEGFHYASLNLDEIVSCHSEPFRRLPEQAALGIQAPSVAHLGPSEA